MSLRGFVADVIVDDYDTVGSTHQRVVVQAMPTLFELRNDLGAQQLDVAHHLFMGQVTELAIAEQLIEIAKKELF